MEITPRMRAIIDFVNGAGKVADIGCDHGRISAAMILENRARQVFACDISEQSLQKTKDMIACQNIAGITPLVSDGLAALKNERLDCIVISGMGGLLIRDIIAAGLETARGAKRLVLGPQGNECELRTFLYLNGFCIRDEAIIKDDGHYYQVIAAEKGYAALPDEVYLHFGYYPSKRREATQKEFLQNKLCEIERIVTKAEKGKNTQEYLTEKRKMRNQIMEVLRCL